jgi:hypothetical protein
MHQAHDPIGMSRAASARLRAVHVTVLYSGCRHIQALAFKVFPIYERSIPTGAAYLPRPPQDIPLPTAQASPCELGYRPLHAADDLRCEWR